MIRRLLLLCFIFSTPALAEVYQWVDDKGKRHFSDTPPPNQQQIQEISGSLKAGNIDEGHKEVKKLQKLFAKPTNEEREYEKNKRVSSGSNSKKQQEYCSYLKSRLQKISRRVVFVDKQGNDVKVSEVERKERVKNLEKLIKKKC